MFAFYNSKCQMIKKRSKMHKGALVGKFDLQPP